MYVCVCVCDVFVDGYIGYLNRSSDFFPFDRNAYENCVVLEARICYDVAKLMYLNSER